LKKKFPSEEPAKVRFWR